MESRIESELVRKCQSGSPAFFEPLVRAYEPGATALAVGILGDMDAARDAVQEAFVKAYKALSRFDADRPFRPWLFQIVRNHCRDMLRSAKVRRRKEEMNARLAEPLATSASDPERDRRRAEARELLWAGLSGIEEHHREILVLKELEGLTYSELAEVLGIPEGTVASRLYHARRTLKETLESMGASYP